MAGFRNFVSQVNLPHKRFEPTEIQMDIFDMFSFGNLTNSVWMRQSGVTTAIILRMLYEAVVLNRYCVYITNHGETSRLMATDMMKRFAENTFRNGHPSIHSSSIVQHTYSVDDGARMYFKKSFEGTRGLRYDSAFLDLSQNDLMRWQHPIYRLQHPAEAWRDDGNHHAAPHVHVLYHTEPEF